MEADIVTMNPLPPKLQEPTPVGLAVPLRGSLGDWRLLYEAYIPKNNRLAEVVGVLSLHAFRWLRAVTKGNLPAAPGNGLGGGWQLLSGA